MQIIVLKFDRQRSSNHRLQSSGSSFCCRLHMESLCYQLHLRYSAFCIHLNQEQNVEIIRIIGQIMCIIVLKPTPLLHHDCVHHTRLFDAQTVFEYNSQPDLSAQVQYLRWQALTRLVPATKNN